MEQLLYDVPQVMAMTRLGRTRIFEEIATGSLRSVLVGRRRLIPAEELRRWVAALDESGNHAPDGQRRAG